MSDWYEQCPICNSRKVKPFWTFDYLNKCEDCEIVYNVVTGKADDRNVQGTTGDSANE